MSWHKSVFPVVPVISIVIIAGCGQSGPTNADLKTSLQNAIPAYWEVASLKIEKRENLGTRTNPVLQARFQAILKLKEDTFTSAERLESVDYARQRDVNFISLVTEKGETVELYGLAVSQIFQNSWKTEFKLDQDPISELGKPRSAFEGKTVLRNSPEEEKFKSEVKQQIESEKKAILANLMSGQNEGNFNYNYRGKRRFVIKFSSGDPALEKVAGEIRFRGSSGREEPIFTVKGFEGSLSDKELKLTVNKIIKQPPEDANKYDGETGTILILPVEKLEGKPRVIEGTWEHIDGNTGEVSISLKWDN